MDHGQWVRRTRRHPRPTQYDYLHLKRLLDDLRAALAAVPGPVREVLDVFCGARPYDDLLPAGARCTGLDITDEYGVADVVTDEFLPFAGESFDLVLCIEAFHYVADPAAGMAELRRVLRPGGSLVLTVPLVWEYDRDVLEHRYTGPSLLALFGGWEDVELVENGGRAVSWTTLTCRMVALAAAALPRPLRRSAGAIHLAINGLGVLLDGIERRRSRSSTTLPMNMLVRARRPR